MPIIDDNILPTKTNYNNFQTRLNAHSGFLLGMADLSFSLRTFGAGLYNELPPHIMASKTIKTFKSALRSHLFDK